MNSQEEQSNCHLLIFIFITLIILIYFIRTLRAKNGRTFKSAGIQTNNNTINSINTQTDNNNMTSSIEIQTDDDMINSIEIQKNNNMTSSIEIQTDDDIINSSEILTNDIPIHYNTHNYKLNLQFINKNECILTERTRASNRHEYESPRSPNYTDSQFTPAKSINMYINSSPDMRTYSQDKYNYSDIKILDNVEHFNNIENIYNNNENIYNTNVSSNIKYDNIIEITFTSSKEVMDEYFSNNINSTTAINELSRILATTDKSEKIIINNYIKLIKEQVNMMNLINKFDDLQDEICNLCNVHLEDNETLVIDTNFL